MLILGIDTACDETAAAVVADGHDVRSNVIFRQDSIHAPHDGVVPELAARTHVSVITHAIHEALSKSGTRIDELDAVAVNCQHGLLRSVVIGAAAAKGLALGRNIPLVGVHHVEAHLYSALIELESIPFPHICLTVSGGHNLLIRVNNHGDYRLLGRTLDDSAGEAYDKVAVLLGLGFPGGRAIDELAACGDGATYKLPRPLLASGGSNFSFSGLKTAVIRAIARSEEQGEALRVADLAASFQQAVVDVLVRKTIRAALSEHVSTITMCGGVAANSQLRRDLPAEASANGIRCVVPSRSYCTDNGAMIATLGYYRLRAGHTSSLDIEAYASAPLGAAAIMYDNRRSTDAVAHERDRW